jgi:hypothetical protein
MGGKPEAGSPAKPAKKRKMTPEEQHALFVKTARELGVDETGAEFERAFDKIISAPDSSALLEPRGPSRRSRKAI